MQVRNHVVTRWRADVSRHLSLDDAQSGVLTELRHYAKAAWVFLNAAGYINFGVSPAIAKRTLGGGQERGSVIVVGAGLAGAFLSASLGMSSISHANAMLRRQA